MKSLHVAFAAAVGLAACSAQDGTSTQQPVEQVDKTGEHVVDAEMNLKISVVDVTGEIQDLNSFVSDDDVYLSVERADATKPALAADYAWQVIDANGAVMSFDEFDCRQLRLTADGIVDHVYTNLDSTCDRIQIRTESGSRIIGLAPLRDALANADGAMKYTLKFAPLATCGSDDLFDDAISLPFVIQPYVAACGNGTLDEGEECDDGNGANDDGCDAACANEPSHECGCGDGIIQEGEDCDDGGLAAGDGCNEHCKTEPPVCGNGVVEAGETCDDGNADEHDMCRSDCTPCEPVEPPPPPPACGNGILEEGEQCDDGNTDDHGDACHNDCTPCDEVPPRPPAPVCGNGVVEDGEACDDGNADDHGDACHNDCSVCVPGDDDDDDDDDQVGEG